MRRVLGRGLAQLLGEQDDATLKQVRLDQLIPNARQPRTYFDEEALSELAESIRRVGVMQPLIVRPLDDHRFEIIAGERRWHAAKLAGLEEIPVVIRSADASEALQLALIENIQREDISPLECANAYQALIMEHGLTQDDVAQHVGKSRPAVANALRLLRLPLEIRESLARGEISEGHARALLQFDTEAEQLLIHRRILEKGLNVREVERLAKGSTVAPAIREKPNRMREPNELESSLSEFFGTPVSINRQGKGGKIEVEFYNEDDLSRILEKLDIRL